MAAKKKAAEEDELLKRAEELERQKEYLDKMTFGGDQREVADELSVVPNHPADIADITMQREVDYTRKAMIDEELEQIHEAMHRKEQGLYGICEDCGKPIPKARLEARPQATHCIDCQRKREGSR